MAWIHIDDMVDGIRHLLSSEEAQGVYNLTSPNPNTNHFFSIALAKRLERPCIFRVPLFSTVCPAFGWYETRQVMTIAIAINLKVFFILFSLKLIITKSGVN